MKQLLGCYICISVAFILLPCCYANAGIMANTENSRVGTTNLVLRLNAITVASNIDSSEMRSIIRQLGEDKEPEAVHALLKAYHLEKERVRGDEVPSLIIETLEKIGSDAAGKAILKITKDIRTRESSSQTQQWEDRRYDSTLYAAIPLLANLGKQGLEELQNIYSSPTAGWIHRVNAKKHLILSKLRQDTGADTRVMVEVLVSHLSRKPDSWFEGKSASIDNKAVMRALQSLGSSSIPYIHEKSREIAEVAGANDVVASELATLADIMKQNEALRLERQKQDSVTTQRDSEVKKTE